MGVAIVTGAGGGIGRAVAGRLARMGYAVVLAGRTAGTLEATAAEVRKNFSSGRVAAGGGGGLGDGAGGDAAAAGALVVVADVGRAEQVERLVGEAMDEYGRVDVVFNGAGYAPMIPASAVTPEQWRQILDVNLSSAFYLTRAVWPIMERQHFEHVADHRGEGGGSEETAVARNAISGGVIVHVSSAATRDPFPGLGAYAVAKAGVNMLTQVTAREGEPIGIRVYCVAPSGVETALFRSLMSKERVPTAEILLPGDVAETVGAMVDGGLRWSSGETVYVHRRG